MYDTKAHAYDTVVNYRARYYDPAIGRFISEDPIRFASGTTNFYAYVGDDPINYIDPFGLARIAANLNVSRN